MPRRPATQHRVGEHVPPAPDALLSYQQDMLAEMRRFVTRLKKLRETAEKVLVEQTQRLSDLEAAGHELREYAFGDDGLLLNESAEEMTDAIDNGLIPDIEDFRGRVLEALGELEAEMGKKIRALEAIEVPPDAMVEVAGDDDE